MTANLHVHQDDSALNVETLGILFRYAYMNLRIFKIEDRHYRQFNETAPGNDLEYFYAISAYGFFSFFFSQPQIRH